MHFGRGAVRLRRSKRGVESFLQGRGIGGHVIRGLNQATIDGIDRDVVLGSKRLGDPFAEVFLQVRNVSASSPLTSMRIAMERGSLPSRRREVG